MSLSYVAVQRRPAITGGATATFQLQPHHVSDCMYGPVAHGGAAKHVRVPSESRRFFLKAGARMSKSDNHFISSFLAEPVTETAAYEAGTEYCDEYCEEKDYHTNYIHCELHGRCHHYIQRIFKLFLAIIL